MFRMFLICFGLLVSTLLANGQENDKITQIKMPQVTISKKNMSLSDTLTEFARQTSIAIQDERIALTDPAFDWQFDNANPWQVLDRIAEKIHAKLKPYVSGNAIALRDGGLSKHRSYSGPVRCLLKKISVSKDFQDGEVDARLRTEFAWGPFLQPYYLEVEKFSATYASPSEDDKVIRYTGKNGGEIPVTGKKGIDLDLRIPFAKDAPQRLISVEGTLVVKTASAMMNVTFADIGKIFDKNESLATEKNGVSVTVRDFATFAKGHWTMELEIAYPPGGPDFDSYQSWLGNNKIQLTNRQDAKIVFQPRDLDIDVLQLNSRKATILCRFVERTGTPRLENPSDWILEYRIPERVVEIRLPFSFENIDVP